MGDWCPVSTDAPPARPRGRVRRIGRAVVADTRPLRESPDYRRLWFGASVSQLGTQMTSLAVAVEVYDISRSTFKVGLVGLAQLVPLIAFGLYGGAIVDAFDRRRVTLIAQSGMWVVSGLLLVQAVLDVESLALLYALVALQSAFSAVSSPAQSAILPRLLPGALLPAANALSQLSFNLGFTLGPLIAGVLVGASHFAVVYAVDVVTFSAAMYAVWRLPPMPPLGHVPRAGLRSVLEGLRFLATRPNVLMTFLVDLCAMVLAQPRSLFPAVARSWYGSAAAVGLLAGSTAIGSLIAGLSSGWLGRVRHQGRVVCLAVMAYGAAVAGFGLTRVLWLGVAMLALSGAADMVSAAFRGTILQDATPDEMRGRLQGVFIVVVAGGPRLGEFVAGTGASIFSPTVAVVAGGCACILGVVALASRFRGFLAYDARHPTP